MKRIFYSTGHCVIRNYYFLFLQNSWGFFEIPPKSDFFVASQIFFVPAFHLFLKSWNGSMIKTSIWYQNGQSCKLARTSANRTQLDFIKKIREVFLKYHPKTIFSFLLGFSLFQCFTYFESLGCFWLLAITAKGLWNGSKKKTSIWYQNGQSWKLARTSANRTLLDSIKKINEGLSI